MSRHFFPFMISQPLNLDLTLALVAILLVTTVQADNGLGTDAPAPVTDIQPSTTAASTGGNGGLSKTAKIVIGVVVGMVGISAICGAVFFFCRRTKKRSDKTKRHETMNSYHDAQRAAHRQHQMPFRSQRQPDPEQGMIEIAKIERENSQTIRDSVLPKYDPSSFPSSQYSIDLSRGAMSLDMPREPLLSYHNHHNRNSLSFSQVIAPLPLPPPPPPLPPMPPAVAWNRRSRVETSNDTRTNSSANNNSSVPAVSVSTGSQERPKGPKKPKPTLARLITNL
ncbi:hypothetical protein UA08_08222 [Talaromyces atroroseus]|uniref:Mid2 domain-containing protein n=1 Tax=Talaromyces atroroseus TaxID=1441469 RepID=A0A225A7H1_TALAT|nr:hypothetical protein UA08_08222 [Talaromyces atroroseus]OKL56452.1 hypothetical protein UA08_08222 [Talaromyces atroroseus]